MSNAPGIHHDRSSGRRLLIVLGVLVAIGLVGLGVYTVLSDDNPDDAVADGDTDAIDNGVIDQGRDSLESAALDELDAALDAVQALNGEPLALWEVQITLEQVDISIQAPDQPDAVERYTWRDGGLGQPQPVTLADAGVDVLPDVLFDRDLIHPEDLDAVLQNAATQVPAEAQPALAVHSITMNRRAMSGLELEQNFQFLVTLEDAASKPYFLTYDLDLIVASGLD